MKPSPEHEALFSRACDGLASAEELAELHRLLRHDPAVLDAWLHYTALHAELLAGAVLALTGSAAQADTTVIFPGASANRNLAPRRLWPRWMPQAAAGLVVGLLAASVVWALVLPPALRSLPVLEEDFENTEAPLAVRTPLESGVWRSDAAEIVGAETGVSPARGQRMMRFLRADFDGRTKPAGGHIAAAYRLIDLRPFRRELADGAAVVEVSASFNASNFPAEERYGCAISLFALEQDSLPDRAGRLGSTLTNESLAMARSSRTLLDHDTSTWQRLTTELRLPAHAEFLVVRLHVSQAFEASPDYIFTGSYVDGVQVALTRRTPLP